MSAYPEDDDDVEHDDKPPKEKKKSQGPGPGRPKVFDKIVMNSLHNYFKAVPHGTRLLKMDRDGAGGGRSELHGSSLHQASQLPQVEPAKKQASHACLLASQP